MSYLFVCFCSFFFPSLGSSIRSCPWRWACVYGIVFVCVKARVCICAPESIPIISDLLANWKIPSILPSRHPKTPTQSDPTTKPSRLLLLWINVCMCACWWWKNLGANVGVDYPPPLPLWSGANGTNCTVLSLMHWWAFSISVLLSATPTPLPPSHTSLIQSACNMSQAMCGTVIGLCNFAAKCCFFFFFFFACVLFLNQAKCAVEVCVLLLRTLKTIKKRSKKTIKKTIKKHNWWIPNPKFLIFHSKIFTPYWILLRGLALQLNVYSHSQTGVWKVVEMRLSPEAKGQGFSWRSLQKLRGAWRELELG